MEFGRFAILGLIFAVVPASALTFREDIGVLKIHDLLVRPSFFLGEGGEGSFSMGESSLAFRWELESKYAGVIRLGPRSLINPSARYVNVVNDDIVPVEAYAELNHPYGRFRLGRMPVEFGYEGQQWERSLIFPRSLLYRRRATMLRDVGGSYEIRHNNFYTFVAIHNGESDADQDGKMWQTARWGFANEKFELGAAGQTGSTEKAQTAASGDTLAAVDVNLDAKWRMGGIYGALHKKTWEWVLEFYMGEREQEEPAGSGRFAVGHSDISVEFGKLYSAHIRYDTFDPNLKLDGDLQREISLALVLSNKTHSSNLILIGTKVLEEQNQRGNDELRLIWSLSPSGIVRF
jgi:hypothetical protein